MDERRSALLESYERRFSGREKYRDQVWRILCTDYFRRHVAADARVLDLGCGWGEFINNVEAGTKYAMDLNPGAGQRLGSGIRFICQDCSAQWPLAENSLDVVFTSNFLEHLPDKQHVERTLSEARRCLRAEGLIVCLGPNARLVPGAYWDFWDHLVPITERSLTEVLRLKGFRVEASIARFLPYSMSTGMQPPLPCVRLYLRMPLLWALFGKQFLVVARKAGAVRGQHPS